MIVSLEVQVLGFGKARRYKYKPVPYIVKPLLYLMKYLY